MKNKSIEGKQAISVQTLEHLQKFAIKLTEVFASDDKAEPSNVNEASASVFITMTEEEFWQKYETIESTLDIYYSLQ